MGERMYTRAQKEASWKQKGLLRPPKSHRQGMLAIAAQEYIEGLGCYPEVRRLLAAGERPRDVALFIQRHNELPILTFNSIKKYAQAYRRFFIPPLETFRSRTEETSVGRSLIVRHRLGLVVEGLREIRELEELARSQSERIRDQLEKETQMGFPLPGLRREIEMQGKLLSAIIQKKIALGIYSRESQDANMRQQSFVDRRSPEERQRAIEVGNEILAIIEASKSNSMADPKR
jgi:hypothetical protein